MERTQIYLSEGQTRELDRRARMNGTTRSHLIREAVERYLEPSWDAERFKGALAGIAGIWGDRDDLDHLHAGLKQRDRDRLGRLWAEERDSGDGPVDGGR
ncbi:MAG: CopG family transcriptional regulator [Candidatus Limnocylindrales bacterium]